MDPTRRSIWSVRSAPPFRYTRGGGPKGRRKAEKILIRRVEPLSPSRVTLAPGLGLLPGTQHLYHLSPNPVKHPVGLSFHPLCGWEGVLTLQGV